MLLGQVVQVRPDPLHLRAGNLRHHQAACEAPQVDVGLAFEIGQRLLRGERVVERRHECVETRVVEGLAAVVIVAHRREPGLLDRHREIGARYLSRRLRPAHASGQDESDSDSNHSHYRQRQWLPHVDAPSRIWLTPSPGHPPRGDQPTFCAGWGRLAGMTIPRGVLSKLLMRISVYNSSSAAMNSPPRRPTNRMTPSSSRM